MRCTYCDKIGAANLWGAALAVHANRLIFKEIADMLVYLHIVADSTVRQELVAALEH